MPQFQLNPINPQPTVTLWQLWIYVKPLALQWRSQFTCWPETILKSSSECIAQSNRNPIPIPHLHFEAQMICAHISSVRFSFIIFQTLFISMEKAKRFVSFHFEFGTHRIPDFLIEICIYIKFRLGVCVCVCFRV